MYNEGLISEDMKQSSRGRLEANQDGSEELCGVAVLRSWGW